MISQQHPTLECAVDCITLTVHLSHAIYVLPRPYETKHLRHIISLLYEAYSIMNFFLSRRPR